ncbi:hypothetical protein TRFO_26661 [Tritrichomonas foetus]|uniref:C2 domain-containing protein n=1 Tax=Tritrichomonas foetus TaxID=1144522 RepID=A0A1J4K418_9EUKA|nr:hypothetical protein TRFO_26661 [Tritrichomonas foetus]|eukprot:OHT05584.1 hypothetical protein TRFO_26661 [Tritrichomonas foetus]
MCEFPASYKLCIQIKRGQDLLPGKNGQNPSPYIVFQFQGADPKMKTKVVPNNPDPVFNSSVILDGYFIGSDLLNVWVYNRDEENDPESDECIGFSQLYMNDFKLGSNQNFTIDLSKYNEKKKRIQKNSPKGEAGQLFCVFHLAQLDDEPFMLKEWVYPLYQAWFDVIAATNIPDTKNSHHRYYIKVGISPACNKQNYKTKSLSNAIPVWNERYCILLDNYLQQTIEITLHNKVKNGEDEVLSVLRMPLSKCKVGHVFEERILMTAVDEREPAVLQYRLQIVAKGTDPFQFIKITEEEIEAMPITTRSIILDDESEENKSTEHLEKEQQPEETHEHSHDHSHDNKLHCSFLWGEYSSDYSTDFTGYSNGHSLSGPHTSDENNDWHIHEELNEDEKPNKVTNVKATIIGIDDIAVSSPDSKVFVTIQEWGRMRPKGEPKRFDVSQSDYAKEVEYKNVKKGYSIEVLLYEVRKNEPKLLAGKKWKIKDITFKDGEIQSFNLLSRKQMKLGITGDEKGKYGKIGMIFSQTINYY